MKNPRRHLLLLAQPAQGPHRPLRRRSWRALLREPPEAEQSKCRVGRALGKVGAALRLCVFDIRDEKGDSMLPHDGLEGVHGVWLMEGVSAASRPSW